MKIFHVISTWSDIFVRARSFEQALKKARKHIQKDAKDHGLSLANQITSVSLTKDECI